MALKGRRYVVTAAAVQPLTSAFDPDLGHKPLQEILFTPAPGNTGEVFIGPSNVTTTANGTIIVDQLAASGVKVGPFPMGSVYADDFYVVGTANDVLYINVVLY